MPMKDLKSTKSIIIEAQDKMCSRRMSHEKKFVTKEAQDKICPKRVS